MFILILILIIVIIYGFVGEARNKELKTNNREEVIEQYNRRIIRRVVLWIIFAVQLIIGTSSESTLNVLLGMFGCNIMLILIISAIVKKKKYVNMSDQEYTNKQTKMIREDEEYQQTNDDGILTLLKETKPSCPHCGSPDTGFSDDYKMKRGLKEAGAFVMGQLSGVRGHIIKMGMPVRKEYRCNQCGHIFTVATTVPPSQEQNQHVSDQTDQVE